MGIVDKVRGLGLGMVIWILAVPIFLFTLFPLLSCIAHGMSGIYLVEVVQTASSSNEYANTRIGYYGLCLQVEKAWYCTSTASQSAKSLATHYGESRFPTAITSFQEILNIQHGGFVPILTAAGLAWLISLILVTLVILAGTRAGRILRLSTKVMANAAFVLMVASAWGICTATAAIRDLNNQALDDHYFSRGNLLFALQWVAVVLVCVHAWASCAVANQAGSGGKGTPPPYYLG